MEAQKKGPGIFDISDYSLEDIALLLSYPEIMIMCGSVKGFQFICDDSLFWKRKLKREYPDEDLTELTDEQFRAKYEALMADQIDERIEKLDDKIAELYRWEYDELEELRAERNRIENKIRSEARQKRLNQMKSGKSRRPILTSPALERVNKSISEIQENFKIKRKEIEEKKTNLGKLTVKYRKKSQQVLPLVPDYRYIEVVVTHDIYKIIYRTSEDSLNYLKINRKLKALGLIKTDLKYENVIGLINGRRMGGEWPLLFGYVDITDDGQLYIEATMPGETDRDIPLGLRLMGLEKLKERYNFPFDISESEDWNEPTGPEEEEPEEEEFTIHTNIRRRSPDREEESDGEEGIEP